MVTTLSGCVLTDVRGRIGLLHRNTPDFIHWELPGGKVNKNESEKEAAIRELLEELGVKVQISEKLGKTTFSDYHGNFIYTWFKAEIIDGVPNIREPRIFDDFQYFDINKLGGLNLSANMKNLYSKLLSREISF